VIYPPTRRSDQVDLLHGEEVADPYRWLEDTESPETRAWIDAQNEVTAGLLAAAATRADIEQRLTELWDYPKYGVPSEEGGRWFQSRQIGLADQPCLYVMDSPDDEGRVLLDPNTMSADGTVAVGNMAVSDDGSLLAYGTSAAGSDWVTWHVRRVDDGTELDDVVEWAKFSTASWLKDGSGFFYNSAQRPEQGAELLAKTGRLSVRFHRLGSSGDSDPVIFERPDEPEAFPSARVTEDGRWLLVSVGLGSRPETELYAREATNPDAPWLAVIDKRVSSNMVVTNVGDDLIIVTDRDATRFRVVRVSVHDPGHWTELIAEATDTLSGAVNFGGRLVCHYMHDATSRLRVFELDGTFVREIELPSGSAVIGLSGSEKSQLMHVQLTGFTDSGSTWSHRLDTGETERVRAPGCPIDPDLFVTEQVFVTSDDGTQVPMFLTHRRDVEPTGEVPTMLYAYGGFGIPMMPAFSVFRAVWVERGGLLAVACLRGGGEYGREWHDAGRLANKQNVFDDFCACAKWLASSGWTRVGRLAINGGSNGGLLVGAVLTQHPELFGAAVPEVGVLDLLRFHKFTIGWAWTSDYGSPDNPEEYAWLRAYSPLHNVRAGTSYPPTLVMTGDHDDRVIPGHSFKFAAALQAAQGGDQPVVIRVETSAGHGLGKPTRKVIKERADVLAFCELALGVTRP